jgi:hypothetical protein
MYIKSTQEAVSIYHKDYVNKSKPLCVLSARYSEAVSV